MEALKIRKRILIYALAFNRPQFERFKDIILVSSNAVGEEVEVRMYEAGMNLAGLRVNRIHVLPDAIKKLHTNELANLKSYCARMNISLYYVTESKINQAELDIKKFLEEAGERQ